MVFSGFMKNHKSLAINLANNLKYDQTERVQDNFADELDSMFDYLNASLISFDYRGFNKADLKLVDKTFPKKEFIQAFDSLSRLIPESKNTKEFNTFFRDNVNYIKNLI